MDSPPEPARDTSGLARDTAAEIRRGAGRILAEWTTSARALPHARELEQPRLLDHIPQILERIAALVEGGDPPQEVLGGLPEVHALERLDVGYDLAEVTSEYGELRRCLARVWADAGHVDATGLLRMNEGVDRAIQAAVSGYARARQRTLEGLERVSVIALKPDLLHDFDAFLDQLLRVILETTEAVDTALILLREGDLLRARAAVGLDEEVTSRATVAIGECFSGRVAATATPQTLTDAANDPLVRSDAIRRRGVKALYGVPLLRGSEVLGVALFGSLTAREFGEDDRAIFRALARRATALIERRQAETALQERDERLRLAVEATGLGTFAWDAETGELEWSERTAELLGETPGAPASLDAFVAHVHAEDRARVRSELERALGQGPRSSPYAVEYRAEGPGGRVRWIEARAVVRAAEGSGRPARLIGTVLDRTSQHEREEAMRAVQDQLRDAVRARDQILGVVSHDLRNALNLVGLSAVSLQKLAQEGEGARRLRRLVDNVSRGVDGMARLIADLLDVAAIDAGRLSVCTTPIEAGALVAEAVETYGPLAREKGLTLAGDVEAAAGARVHADQDRIFQVLGNLIGNAVKYTRPGGRVVVRAAPEPAVVRLSVTDDGQGIPAEELPRVFERGYRGAASEHRGLGFGLSIVKGIVEAHGGAVSVRSEVGGGTTVTFTLRRAP